MKNAFLKVIHLITYLWRTLVSTFRKKHIYEVDVDQDGIDEIVVDINGRKEINSEEEHELNDSESN